MKKIVTALFLVASASVAVQSSAYAQQLDTCSPEVAVNICNGNAAYGEDWQTMGYSSQGECVEHVNENCQGYNPPPGDSPCTLPRELGYTCFD